MKIRHFLSITDFSAEEIRKVFQISLKLKKEIERKGKNKAIFKGKTMAMIFEKPSLRTRISFEIAMTQLGGHAIYLGPNDIQMGKRETSYDVGKVTSSMADFIMARTFKHESIEELASGSSVPVINALSDLEHPCQILADFLTIIEKKGKIEGLKLAYLGDGKNNVTHSLVLASSLLGGRFFCASPKGYGMKKKVVSLAKKIAQKTKATIVETTDPEKAAYQADVLITDTWISMGNELERKKRLKIFPPYQVNQKIMSLSRKDSIFMHCLPAYREKEVSSEVINGFQSVVFEEAENRLHAQKGLLVFLFNKGGPSSQKATAGK
ncbi:ornithine carbamoyltransferase [Candidatus Microgenomates bacterium]|nr:ornithine carbamoyltransferase [Candidatus Microgenomates bacterium]